MGRVHVRVASGSPLVEVVAVADVREEAARTLAAESGVKTVYTDADALFADPHVEAVVLALPTCYRFDLALRAFAQGRHVLTEKPVAMNSAQVRQLIQARGDLTAGCCSSRYRFLESTRLVANIVQSGTLGELRVLRCRGIIAARGAPDSIPPAWRLSKSLNGGGILVNWGCYELDYLLGVSGWSLRPRLVLAQTWTVPPRFTSHVAPGSDAETHVLALIRCEGGPVISYERGEYVAARSESAWQIIGSEGSLHFTVFPNEDSIVIHDEASSENGVVSTVLFKADEDKGITHVGPVEDFAQAIRECRQPMTGLEQALMVQQISDAIYASAEQGKAVEIG
jgi:predicted dehydrogenase